MGNSHFARVNLDLTYAIVWIIIAIIIHTMEVHHENNPDDP
jgi:hypothetical protein